MVCCRDKKFLRYKLGRLFDMMDNNKDGKFQKTDYIGLGIAGMDNMAAIGYAVTAAHRKKVQKIFGPAYYGITCFGFGGKNKKRWVGYLSVMTQMPGFKMIGKHLFKRVSQVYDFDGSGDFSIDEFTQVFCKPIGLSEEEAKESFKLLDTNHDGVLDIEEFAKGITHYLSDLEDNKWAHMFGRIDYNPDKWDDDDESKEEVKEGIEDTGIKLDDEASP